MDFLPEIDREKHRKRAKMMEESPTNTLKYGRISPNVRVLRREEVIPAKIQALKDYIGRLEGVSRSGPADIVYKDAQEKLSELRELHRK